MTFLAERVPPFNLERGHRPVFWATFLGWGLDGFDYMLYTLVLTPVAVAFGLSSGQAGLIGTVTLLFSAVGGVVAGALSDRVGRVRVLAVAVVVFSVFTALSGVATSYPELLVYRGFEGLGFGGEWAVGAVLISETVPARRRGSVLGVVQGAWAWGWALAVLASVIVLPTMGDLGWRVMFWLGLLPALLALYVLRKVPESPVWRDSRARTRERATPAGLTGIFRRPVLRFTVLATVLAIGMQSGYYAIFTWLPTFLRKERGLGVVGSGGYLAVVIVGSFVGYVAAGYANDRFGRRPTFAVLALGSAATIIAYAYGSLSNTAMLFLSFPLGFFGSGMISGFGPFLAELFPTSVRGAGQGFCYNVGRGVAAAAPALVGVLSTSWGLAGGISLFAACAYGLFLLVLLFLPETRGRELDDARATDVAAR
jgi:MFS family permease